MQPRPIFNTVFDSGETFLQDLCDFF